MTATPPPLSLEDLGVIHARWEPLSDGDLAWGVAENVTTPDERRAYLADTVSDDDGPLWAVFEQRDGKVLIHAFTGDCPTSPTNAVAFAHARRDVYALLAEVLRLRDELDARGTR